MFLGWGQMLTLGVFLYHVSTFFWRRAISEIAVSPGWPGSLRGPPLFDPKHLPPHPAFYWVLRVQTQLPPSHLSGPVCHKLSGKVSWTLNAELLFYWSVRFCTLWFNSTLRVSPSSFCFQRARHLSSSGRVYAAVRLVMSSTYQLHLVCQAPWEAIRGAYVFCLLSSGWKRS